MGLRVRVATSVCLVSSGLFIAGLGGAMAFAEPDGDPGSSDTGQTSGSADTESDGPGGVDQAGDTHPLGEAAGQGEDPQQGIAEVQTGQTPPRETATKESPTTEPTKPEEPCPRKPCPGEPNEPPDEPETSGGGGGGGSEPVVPQALGPEPPPEMQLPPALPAPALEPEPEPAAIEVAPGLAASGVATAAPLVPLVPIITLPVIVAPSIGLGEGAGSPATPLGPSLPPAPMSVIVEPPSGREPLQAIEENIAAVSETFRIGYVEYLRTAHTSQLMAIALPGAAGILLLTCAGGFVGYRQAKAGHTIRPGSARFLK